MSLQASLPAFFFSQLFLRQENSSLPTLRNTNHIHISTLGSLGRGILSRCVPTMLSVSPRVSPRDTCPIFTYITGYGWKIAFSPLLTFPPVGTGVQAAVIRGPAFPVPWSPSPEAMRWMCIHLTSKLGKDNYEKVQLRSLLFPLGASCLQSVGPGQGWAPDALPRRAPHSKSLSAVKTSTLISQTSQNPGSRKRRRVAFTWFPQIFQDVHEPEPKPLPHGPQAPTHLAQNLKHLENGIELSRFLNTDKDWHHEPRPLACDQQPIFKGQLTESGLGISFNPTGVSPGSVNYRTGSQT